MTPQRQLVTIQRLANQAFQSVGQYLAQMGVGCDVRPTAASDVFRKEADSNAIRLFVGPVAFRLKEKPASDRADIIVVVCGQVNFSLDADLQTPLACFFKTEVGYFRKNGRTADHVFGAHYDNDINRAGHPIYHAQMKSMAHLLEDANALLNENLSLKNDHMEKVAGRIRIPTAHMDTFSVFLQLLADHLVNDNWDERHRDSFERTRVALAFFRSDPRRAERLDEVHRQKCFRAGHWYPDPKQAQRPLVV